MPNIEIGHAARMCLFVHHRYQLEYFAVSLRGSLFKIHEVAVKAKKDGKLCEFGGNLPRWNNAGIVDTPIWLEDGLGGQCYMNPNHPPDEAIETYLGPLASSPHRKMLTNAYAAALDPNPLAGIESALKNCWVPTRVVWGAGDTIFSQASPDYLARTVPNSLGVSACSRSQAFLSRRDARRDHRRGAIRLELVMTHPSSYSRRSSYMDKMHHLLFRLIRSLIFAGLIGALTCPTAYTSDHLDTPTVIADPAADIGDLFAWTSSDGQRLNLVMYIVAHQFSDKLQYVFHVDSGKQFGKTTKSITILCRFDVAGSVECWAGNVDHVRGSASGAGGLDSEHRKFRVFAGLRDDPFFNNVKGTRAAYNVAGTALQQGTSSDNAGCPAFDRKIPQAILDTWRSTDGGPASNFLAGWKTSALVVSIDLDVVATGGRLLAVWGTVHRLSSMHKQKLSDNSRLTTMHWTVQMRLPSIA
jgi:hypothetical protein